MFCMDWRLTGFLDGSLVGFGNDYWFGFVRYPLGKTGLGKYFFESSGSAFSGYKGTESINIMIYNIHKDYYRCLERDSC